VCSGEPGRTAGNCNPDCNRGRQQPTARRETGGTVITVTDLRWAGQGWRTTGDALLALSAAARAREQRRIAREEMALTS